MKYVSSSYNGVYDEAAHTVTWVVDIAAGSSLDLTVTAVADEYGVLTNIVSVGDKSASVDVKLFLTKLQILKILTLVTM